MNKLWSFIKKAESYSSDSITKYLDLPILTLARPLVEPAIK